LLKLLGKQEQAKALEFLVELFEGPLDLRVGDNEYLHVSIKAGLHVGKGALTDIEGLSI